MNKAYGNINSDCWTRQFVICVIPLNLEQHFAYYRGKSLTYSGHFQKKLQVAEVDNAGGRSLKMLEWM